MSEYSMPSYFQSMPVIGKDLSAFHEDNAAEIQAVEQEIHEIREAALEAGKSTEALNESGQWTAMQRIMELVDEGTWCPLNSLYNPQDNKNGSVGIVKGLGRIDGKWAVIIASDNKKLAGAWVPGQADSLLRGSDTAKRLRIPLVYVLNCSGVKLDEQEKVYPNRRGGGTPFYRNSELNQMGVPVIVGIYGTNPAGGGHNRSRPTIPAAMFKPALLSSLKTYTKQTFLADLFAGLTVGVVAIPLAMAFAIACGLSPTQGLITAIVAGFLISLFSGSKYQIGGPTGAFVIIIMGVLEQYHASGLLVCTLMAGLFLIIFGFCRMGALIRFIPFPVTTGFTSGIAVVIFSTQIKDIFGLTITEKIPGEFIEKWACYFHYFHTINWAALGLAAGTVIITLLSRRFWPRIPAMLVGMLGMTAVSVAFSLPVTTIGQAFGSLPNTLPLPSLPSIDWSTLGALTAPAFTIALLAAIESLLSASVADGMTGGRHKPNMELIAQGIGNIGSALFGGIPATGAIARTATNIKAGAKSPVSGMIHALTLLAILMAFAHYAQQIPLAVLAGILTVVCYNMSEIHTFSRLLKGPRQDAAVLVITFLLTVFVDLVVAVEVGVVLAALLFMGRMAQISDVSAIKNELLENDEEDDGNRSAAKLDIPEGVEVFDVKGPFFFGAVEQFKDQVLETLEHDTKVVILRMRLVPALDATGLNVLSDFCHQCREHGSTLLVCGVQPQPLDVIRHAPFYRELKRYNICENIDAALNRARKIINGPAPKHL